MDQVLLQLQVEITLAEPISVLPCKSSGLFQPALGERLWDGAVGAPRERDEPLSMLREQRRVQLRVTAVAEHVGERD